MARLVTETVAVTARHTATVTTHTLLPTITEETILAVRIVVTGLLQTVARLCNAACGAWTGMIQQTATSTRRTIDARVAPGRMPTDQTVRRRITRYIRTAAIRLVTVVTQCGI